MQHISCTVLENQPVAEACFRLVFRYPEQHQAPNPGQFLTLRLGAGVSPLLRRPFAYSGYDQEARTGELIYERRGAATRLLSALQPADPLDLIGPLGNSFPFPPDGVLPVLVAGGIGLGPMLFLYRRLASAGRTPVLIVGARSLERIPMGSLPAGALICTDDGSGGFHGTVLQFLDREYSQDPPKMLVYACGPHGMMKAVAHWSMDAAVPCWVSLEQTMACAVGACMGCVVKIHHQKQYSRVCSEGPVYPAESIDWSH
jgi:dihydroorotate dehydrogenase electron transfer subunit